MSLKTSPRYFVSPGLRLLPKPALAWSAILALALFTVLCIGAGLGKVLNLAFPAGGLAVGILLFFRYPILYNGFTWWLFFLSPFIRRISDFRSGAFTEPSPILLTPFLVSLITLVTLAKYLPQSKRQGSLPFVWVLGGILYGFCIGLILQPRKGVIVDLFDWLPPIVFGFHLFTNWQLYPGYRRNTQHTFVWGILVMGVYGIFQYMVAPEWERFWLIGANMMPSQGTPEPYGLRVWSTMNSVEPFAGILSAGLLMLFTEPGLLSRSAAVVGYLSLLLTTVRAAWLGWLAGLITLAASLKSHLQIRLFIIIFALAILVIPLTTIEPFSARINSRFETFSQLDQDFSAKSRANLYQSHLEDIVTNVVGSGLSNEFFSNLDSTILAMLTKLGWLGTIFYGGGMFLLITRLFQNYGEYSDSFLLTIPAILMSNLVRLPLNVPILGSNGMLFWGFLALGLAAQKYYRNQKLSQLNQPSIRNSMK